MERNKINITVTENKFKDEIIIQYKINNDDTIIQLFDEEIIHNKDTCKMIIQGNEYEIKKLTKLKNILTNNDIIEIKLKGIQNITNMSYMFSECSNLYSLPDISELNTTNVNDMSCMFSYCSNLNSLPDISKWNTTNVNNMSDMFKDCTKLTKILPKFKN